MSFSSISWELVAGPSVQTIFARLMAGVIRTGVLLFQKRFHAGLVDGAVRLTFRLWDTPRVKIGGRYRVHPIGVVEVDAVSQVKVGEVTDADARAAGFVDRAELLRYLKPVAKKPLRVTTRVYRVELHHGGDGDRVQIALDDDLRPEDVAALDAKLDRLDAKAAWTRQTFALIKKHPRVAASQLAAKVGRETAPFKVNVRKLKKLGLTQSFEVGYELSPRGARYLALTRR
jgi:hypothetical protein